MKDEKRHAVKDAFDFSASFFLSISLSVFFSIVQQRSWYELHFNHVWLIEGGMKTKRRMKKACRGIVSLCKLHRIISLFFLFVTHTH